MTALGVGACARSSRTYQTSAGGVAPADAVALHVQNDNFADMDVYVVSEGLATRLGTATGLSSTNFTLDPSFFPTSELRIVATPIGGNGRASSGPLIVNAGQTIEFRIAPRLRQSTASVR
jgi:hypothetical protein